jgi:phage-related protein
MAFYGLEFIYNNIPSSNFGLFISKIDGQGVNESSLGSSIKLITKKLFRDPVEFFYGVEQAPVLEFELEFFSVNPLSAMDRNIISSWLFGQQTRGTLQILQEDFEGIHFNCIMDSSSGAYVGNIQQGFKAHIICDSPFAWGQPGVVTYTNTTGQKVDDIIHVYNESADSFYTYPTIQFTMGWFGQTFTIRNITLDPTRAQPFSFYNLTSGSPAGETITVDNKRKIVQSSTGDRRLSFYVFNGVTTSMYFSYNWLRLLPGDNELEIEGEFLNFTFTYPVAKKVGG